MLGTLLEAGSAALDTSTNDAQKPESPRVLLAPREIRTRDSPAPNPGESVSFTEPLDGLIEQFRARDQAASVRELGPSAQDQAKETLEPDQEIAPPPEIPRLRGSVIPNEFARIQDLCGRAFSLEAMAANIGKPLCSEYCSTAAEFFRHSVKGNHVWLDAPVDELRALVDHYLT